MEEKSCKDTNLLMELRHVTKRFPGVVAVNDVSLKICKGEVHIIIGENGAGKSTLVKMMAGLYSIDEGEIYFEGKRYKPIDVLDAQHQGVTIIHQELSVMQNRTVAQNVFVGREPVTGILHSVDQGQMVIECHKLFEKLKINIDPTVKVKELSIAQQQMVEVAKAISMNSKLLIMDEPTSSLTQKEIDNLFRITRKLKDNGTAIIYISHRMQELKEIGDKITIMRDGCYIATEDVKTIAMNEIIRMMVGREITNIYIKDRIKPGKEILKTEYLTGLRFRNVSLRVCEHEIVGFAGLVGAGRTELFKAIYGLDPVISGNIYYEGEKINLHKHSTKNSVRSGMCMIPENRKTEGLFGSWSIKDNIAIASLPKMFKAIISEKVIQNEATKGVQKLGVSTTSIDKEVNFLSGGNQQKVAIAKWLVKKNKLFIFDEPTRGIDVGAKSEIYAIMNELAKNGAAIIMISSDMPELVGMSDRVYVMKDGEISGEVSYQDNAYGQERLLSLAVGGEGNG